MCDEFRFENRFCQRRLLPWCIVGLNGLLQALEILRDEVQAEIHFQPFELNPKMGPDGQNITEHISEKYGSTPEQSQKNREAIRARGAEVGFAFVPMATAASTTPSMLIVCCIWPALRGCSCR